MKRLWTVGELESAHKENTENGTPLSVIAGRAGRSRSGLYTALFRAGYGPHPLKQETDESRFWSKVDTSGDCWLWAGSRNGGGYGQFAVRGMGKKAHRYSWEIARGPIPNDLRVCHRCDTPACVRPSHLFLGTQQDNMHDASVKGRIAKNAKHGEANPMAKITAALVRQILLSDLGTVAASQRFGVSASQVTRIRSGKRWAHVYREVRGVA